MKKKVTKALDEVCRLISGGREFPDVLDRVACQFDLSDAEVASVKAHYDAHVVVVPLGKPVGKAHDCPFRQRVRGGPATLVDYEWAVEEAISFLESTAAGLQRSFYAEEAAEANRLFSATRQLAARLRARRAA